MLKGQMDMPVVDTTLRLQISATRRLLPLLLAFVASPILAAGSADDCELAERYIKLGAKEEAAFNTGEALKLYQRAAADCPSYTAWQRVGELAATFDDEETVRSAFQAFVNAYDLAPDAANLAITKAHYAQLAFDNGDRGRGVDLIYEARNLAPNDEWIASVAENLLSESTVLSDADVVRGLGGAAWTPPALKAREDLSGGNGAGRSANTAGSVASAGSKPVAAPDREAVIQAQFSFLSGTTELDDVTRPNVATLANALGSSSYDTKRFEFTGHADVRGEASDNMYLSLRRAEAIRDSIIAMQPNLAGRIVVKGKGEEQPRSFGTTPADHRANRRLEVRLLP